MPGYQQYQQRMMGGYSNRGGPGGHYMGERDHEPDPEQFQKLFIGGLSFETTEVSLKNYFSTWGDIKDCVVMKDSQTKRSRGFGFIKYKSKESIDDVQKNRPHKLDDRDVETKRAMPKDDTYATVQQSVKKMFVGGMKDDTTEDMVRDTFSQYGDIEQIEMIQDKATGKIKGFCFVTFSDYDPVDKLVLKKRISLNNKMVELKKAFAKGEGDLRMGGPGGRMNMPMSMPMGRGGRGDYYGQGGYPGGYGNYGHNFGGGYGPWQGGYDYPNYGPPQGNHQSKYRGYSQNNNYSQNNYGGFNNRR